MRREKGGGAEGAGRKTLFCVGLGRICTGPGKRTQPPIVDHETHKQPPNPTQQYDPLAR